jgi:hypothetical protein
MNFKTLLKLVDPNRFTVTRNDKTWKHTLVDAQTGTTSTFKSADEVFAFINTTVAAEKATPAQHNQSFTQLIEEHVSPAAQQLVGMVAAAEVATEQTTEFDKAMKDMPACVEVDTLAMKTLDDLRWACQIQLDLIEEGQDGTEQDDPAAIKKWLNQYGSPVITPATTMEGQMTPAQKAANSVTEKEQLALKGIINSDFQNGGDPVGHYVWSWSANPFPTQQLKSFGGVVASLEKKGLVKQTDTGEDACVAITQLGMDAYKLLTGQLNEFEVVTTN